MQAFENKELLELISHFFQTTDANALSPLIRDALSSIFESNDVITISSDKTLLKALLLISCYSAYLDQASPLLIICPNKVELAALEQLITDTMPIHHLTFCTLTGGVPYHSQVRNLKKKPNIIVSTPGRLISLLKHKHLHLEHYKYLGLFELDLLFKPDLWVDFEKIMNMSSSEKITFSFSSNFSEKMTTFSSTYLRFPKLLSDYPIPTDTVSKPLHKAIHPSPKINVTESTPPIKRKSPPVNTPENSIGTPLSRGKNWRDEFNEIQISYD